MRKNIKLLLFGLLFFLFFFNFVLAQGELEVPIPGLETQTLPALPEYIRAIFNFSLMIAGFVAFGVLIYAGLRYLTSTGNPAKMADAKDQFYAGILGLFILLSSYLILVTINPQLVILKLPEIKKPEKIFIPEIKPLEIPSTKFQEIPVGTLINSEGTDSEYEGTLHKERLKRIMEVSEWAKKNAEELKKLSKDLRKLTNECACGNTSPGGCSCEENNCSPCRGDPCPNRGQINAKQKEIEIFASAFEKFLKEEFQKNKDDLKKEIDKLKLAENEIIKCSPYIISYDNRLNLENEGIIEIKVIKEIKNFKYIKIGEDPLTFYCGK